MKRKTKVLIHKAQRGFLTIMFVVLMLLTGFSVMGALIVTGTGFFDFHNRTCLILLACAVIFFITACLCAWNGILKNDNIK